jgi:hypothetical protein
MRKIFLSLCTALFCAGAALGATITYTAIGTASGNGELENASATFTTSLNSITVSLSNFLANPNDAGQLFSGITFTLSLAPVSNPSLASSSGTELTITSNNVGGYTVGATSVPAGWGFSFSGATLTLNDLVGGSSPKHTVIGPSNNGTYSGGAYASANASLKGNHNPFLKNATFTITAPGVTTLTTVTGATFMFGTVAGNNIVGVPTAVPEPATVSLFVLAGAGFCARGLIKRKSRNSQSVSV